LTLCQGNLFVFGKERGDERRGEKKRGDKKRGEQEERGQEEREGFITRLEK